MQAVLLLFAKQHHPVSTDFIFVTILDCTWPWWVSLLNPAQTNLDSKVLQNYWPVLKWVVARCLECHWIQEVTWQSPVCLPYRAFYKDCASEGSSGHHLSTAFDVTDHGSFLLEWLEVFYPGFSSISVTESSVFWSEHAHQKVNG